MKRTVLAVRQGEGDIEKNRVARWWNGPLTEQMDITTISDHDKLRDTVFLRNNGVGPFPYEVQEILPAASAAEYYFDEEDRLP